MTLIIGTLCSDGVVLAADSAATMGTAFGFTASIPTARKLHLCSKNLVVGFAGSVGIAQRAIHELDTLFAKGGVDHKNPSLTADRVSTSLRKVTQPELEAARHFAVNTGNAHAVNSAVVQSLLAFPLNNEPKLLAVDEKGLSEYAADGLPFATIGSGAAIADPFMAFVKDVLWPKNGLPSLADATLGVMLTMGHAINANTGGVGGAIQLAQLRKQSGSYAAVILEENDTREHTESVGALKKHIRSWFDLKAAPAVVPVPG